MHETIYMYIIYNIYTISELRLQRSHFEITFPFLPKDVKTVRIREYKILSITRLSSEENGR